MYFDNTYTKYQTPEVKQNFRHEAGSGQAGSVLFWDGTAL